MAVRTDCVHLGGPTGDKIGCGSCSDKDKTRLKLFSCDLHGTCVLCESSGIRGCADCPDYSQKPRPEPDWNTPRL